MSLPLREGGRVTYIGSEYDGSHLTVGDEGKLLSHGGSACHVMWHTGERAGEITLTTNGDLMPQADADQAVRSGHLVSTAVRDTYDRQGNKGLLRTLAQQGFLASIAPATEEALEIVISHIRADAAVQEVLAHLDPDEGDGFVSFTALALLRDAFGEG